MALWDKMKQELDRAGKVAQEAIDEGRIRLEQVRARQLADKAAQRLGYAYLRAHGEGRGNEDAELTRLRATLTEHEAEAARLEAELAVITRRAPQPGATPGDGDFGGNSGASHRPDGTVDTGGAADASPSAAPPPDAPGAPPGERNEWNREHL
ncbi:hypothetical protein [Roseisolibacter sp. H3M3-2]|uniref:hypothetical protein n=1 Tax=Roseisolibacter sp. H3M3-2 TaxID=3031323 RepID=UPI0023DA3085|nr:hypothetical protein [Roseisolibacter sp. H3M3-2]MDF1503524.1 hypothetical protein [Roseisolibacter sp. H3M3-2]